MPGLRFCESSGFRGDAQVRKFQSSEDGVDARVVSLRSFDGAEDFSVFEWEGPRRIHTTETGQSQSTFWCQVFSARW